MEKKYLIIYFGEDGITITPSTRKDVMDLLANSVNEPIEFVDGKAGHYNMNVTYPTYKYLIYKGEVVIPEPVKTVLEYKIP